MEILKQIWSWFGSIVISFIIVVFLGVFVFQSTKVMGHSMDPTLHDKQRVYVSKLAHTFSSAPDYGDIVIIDSRVEMKRTFKSDLLESPLLHLFTRSDDQHIWIKRVIGKPGDVLEYKGHQLYRNGELLNEPYLNEQMNEGAEKSWTVPADHVFVMGDNRNNSMDSRVIGFIPLDHVLGKKLF